MIPPEKSRPPLGDSRDWLAILRGWPVLLLVSAAAAGVAWIYVSVIPPVYESEVRVVLQNLGLGIDKLNTSKGYMYEKQFLATQAEVIKSPNMIARSLKSLPLPPPPATPPEPGKESDPVAAIAESLRVTPLAGTDIVRIVYQNSNPAEATARLQSIVESYREYLRQSEQTSASQAGELLKQRTVELTDSIRQLEQELARARAANDSAAAGDTANDSPLLKELVNRWVNTQTELAAANFDLRDLETGRSDSRRETPAQQSLVELDRQRIAARSQALEAARIFGPSHPERKALDERLASLESDYKTLESRAAVEVRTDKGRLAEQESSLQKLMRTENDRLREANGGRLETERLTAEITRVKLLHSATATTLESVLLADKTLAEGRGSVVVDVLDKFQIPEEPIWPKKIPLTVAAALLGALAAACGLVLIDRWVHPDGPTDRPLAGEIVEPQDEFLNDEEYLRQKEEFLRQEVPKDFVSC